MDMAIVKPRKNGFAAAFDNSGLWAGQRLHFAIPANEDNAVSRDRNRLRSAEVGIYSEDVRVPNDEIG
jgi:hypothetical protein